MRDKVKGKRHELACRRQGTRDKVKGKRHELACRRQGTRDMGKGTWVKAERFIKTPLLDRRGAETDERSESGEAGWWTEKDF